ncbi:tRNA adenosine(34) deaminase TadA [Tetragenococcus koreensis]|uniref:tRNA-specific adenosine deaminase n=1 Tax=Tetragenococcus koreensis TaxID=290335 RepID=A0AAN4UCV1_9ENTE|nr:tRNA adenosine(34) deaminase TadA [Tetragenococcus koreensis]GEN91431.1 tRNA-specific adenosine deaminase [Tetragenococcus koreensis]GEQ50106.1 deaminase [Tetragenococcus koreensis]GEQ52578.1 deaminase [Tetragenococcus koreensis]GEQ55113.1 deaminase [Tetragenococcus koreensis]GEQ57590.1 deaminase [Tetragenococcus koreensis]
MKESSLTSEEKYFFMNEAIKEAHKALDLAEVPIGAIVVLDKQIIGRGYNLRETTQNALKHAEMTAIEEACSNIGSWRLEDAQLFVTLEPCPMCSGAILQSRIEEVYFGAFDLKAGACGSLINLLEDTRFNHWCYVESEVLANTCADLLSDFFKKIRVEKKRKKKEILEKD